MGKRVLIIVLVLVVALFVYLGYNSYDARRAGANGDVFSSDASTSKAKPGSVEEQDGNGQTIVYPPQPADTAPAGQEAQTSVQPQTQGGGEGPEGTPAHDTISPNPPNGMVFSGNGKFQLYRQGNLTWRVNTETGQNCILFATDEEWKKPRVFRAGCGSR
jgi:hypothetical protein